MQQYQQIQIEVDTLNKLPDALIKTRIAAKDRRGDRKFTIATTSIETRLIAGLS